MAASESVNPQQSHELPLFLNLHELETQAAAVLPKAVYDYYRGGSNSETTLRCNQDCWSVIRLMPRMLRNVSHVTMSRSFLGINMDFPVLVAPMAMQGMAHPGAEPAAAHAARKCGVPYIMSTMSTSSQEEVASSGHASLLFQLYVIRNRDVVRGWVRRAEALGFRALVLTVDAQRLGKREKDERNRFRLPPGLRLKVLESVRAEENSDAASASTASPFLAGDGRDDLEGSGLFKLFASEVDDGLTWEVIPWLRSITALPIIIKGILSPRDAEIAMARGVDGIVVSNHGGRQLDGTPTALDALPAVLGVVRGRVPVLVDGGIRRGTDVLKALALGATAVLLGRPVLYGLAVGGEAGVARVLSLLRDELELAMALSGCARLEDINRDLLIFPVKSKM